MSFYTGSNYTQVVTDGSEMIHPYLYMYGFSLIYKQAGLGYTVPHYSSGYPAGLWTPANTMLTIAPSANPVTMVIVLLDSSFNYLGVTGIGTCKNGSGATAANGGEVTVVADGRFATIITTGVTYGGLSVGTATLSTVDYGNTLITIAAGGNPPIASHYAVHFLKANSANNNYTGNAADGNGGKLSNSQFGAPIFIKKLATPQAVNAGNQFNFSSITLSMNMVATT
jgi:hypothetical protein